MKDSARGGVREIRGSKLICLAIQACEVGIGGLKYKVASLELRNTDQLSDRIDVEGFFSNSWKQNYLRRKIIMRLLNFFSIAFLMAGALIFSACTDTDTVEVAVPGPTEYVCPDGETTVTDLAQCPAPEPMDDCDHTLDLRNRVFTGSDGAETVCGSGYSDVIDGGAGDDMLFGNEGKDRINGDSGSDTIDGGAGNDTLYGHSAKTDAVDDDKSDDTISGGEGDDTLRGGGGADSLMGDAGDDDLDGNGGHDSLEGGDGNDELRDDEVGDIDTLDGGDGNDTAIFSGITQAQIDAADNDDTATSSYFHVSLIDGFSEVRVKTKLKEEGVFKDILSNIENVTGSSTGNNNLIGDNGPNTLTGGSNSDTNSTGDVINGMGGDDIIDGGTGGADMLHGGDGSDTLVVSGEASLNATGGIIGDDSNTSGFENLKGGVAEDTLTGNGGDNVLDGGGGKTDNTLRGGPAPTEAERNPVTGKDTFVIWVPRSPASESAPVIKDTIKDFELPGRGQTGVIDRIVVKRLPGTQATPKAGDKVGTDGKFEITTGGVTQEIVLGSGEDPDAIFDDDTMDTIIGDDGMGSPYLIFE